MGAFALSEGKNVPHCGIQYTSKRFFSQVLSHKAESLQNCQKSRITDW